MYICMSLYTIIIYRPISEYEEEQKRIDERYRGNHTQSGQSEEAHHQPCPFLVVDDTRISDTRTHTHTHTHTHNAEHKKKKRRETTKRAKRRSSSSSSRKPPQQQHRESGAKV
ncbi:uncharacterized protein K489DRAFT_265345 [Dissoconium aciculare CBS 342.82]|uniref:Uncharacterized protein n=1 Tax=Dissoconium aciculare CBS 342.82 TaxID=1314786 RepID=A0A6J3M0S7_9PEZI|nr:uncharacterized protein K489DRAFT_265345 [Dissoconium aciculare CBS 342.82]KAF1821099.1 hypothetical protein K489DRAFT_265345 [Dissoconium aciculare CBS 342.82]